MLRYEEDKNYGNTAEEIVEGKKNFICRQYNAFAAMHDKKGEELEQKQVEYALFEKALVDIIKEDMNANPALNIFAGYDAATDFSNAVLLTDKDIFKKFSEEEQKKCRDSYNRIKEVLGKSMFKNYPDFTMKDVLKVDNEPAIYIVQFNYKDKLLSVGIPIFADANTNNFNSIVAGYMLSVPSTSRENSFVTLARNLDYRVISDAYLRWYEDNFKEPEKENPEEPVPATSEKKPVQKQSKKNKAN